tara:strand:+ start:696 stop:968 length:273 start_codon:yes stop_codon:yes gene_type:complete
MFNIFYEHYKKRDGAIYKDLACLNHNERIKMLDSFIKNQLFLIEKKPIQFKFCVYSIAYFQRLKRFCEKNKHIKGFVQKDKKQLKKVLKV